MEGDGVDAIAFPNAAENALNVAAAKMAWCSIHQAGSGDGAAVPDAATMPMLPDVGKLHECLFQLGSSLLSDKRHLLKVGGEANIAVPGSVSPSLVSSKTASSGWGADSSLWRRTSAAS